jgi:peptidoglycan/xylan/chitin deacetylase (PgdA/CDA1 family)
MIPDFSCSFDDGSLYDLKLAEILRKWKIPTIFYIPTCCEIMPDDIRDLAKDFEIGGHSKTHPMDVKKLSEAQMRREIKENKEWLEYLTGKPITKYCHTRGRYNDLFISLLKEYGYKEARTTVVGNLKPTEDPFKTYTTVHAFQRSEYNGEDWLDYAKRMWQEAKKIDGAVYHVWGHSKELFLYGQQDKLEELFAYIYEDLHSTQN